MGKAIVRSFNWSSKIQVEQKKAYAIGLLAVLGFTFIKIRPYFEEKPVYKVFVNGNLTLPRKSGHALRRRVELLRTRLALNSQAKNEFFCDYKILQCIQRSQPSLLAAF